MTWLVAICLGISLAAASGFRVSVDQLDAARTERTKALIFVSPSNPTGAVYPRDEIEAIGRWAVDNDIWVITDEIYEHLVYGDDRWTFAEAHRDVASIGAWLVANGVEPGDRGDSFIIPDAEELGVVHTSGLDDIGDEQHFHGCDSPAG